MKRNGHARALANKRIYITLFLLFPSINYITKIITSSRDYTRKKKVAQQAVISISNNPVNQKAYQAKNVNTLGTFATKCEC